MKRVYNSTWCQLKLWKCKRESETLTWNAALVYLSRKKKQPLSMSTELEQKDMNKYLNLLTATLIKHLVTCKLANMYIVEETGLQLNRQ
jgi:hypothetical protein